MENSIKFLEIHKVLIIAKSVTMCAVYIRNRDT